MRLDAGEVARFIKRSGRGVMAGVLLVGYDPETVDYSNPALPPGMSAEKIRTGIALTLKQMADRGWEGDLCFIGPDETAGQTVERQIQSLPA
jgi:hypothetical protein